MFTVHSNHFGCEYFDCSILRKFDVFQSYGGVLSSFSSLKMRNSQCAMKQNGPDFFFLEGSTFLISDNNLISKTVIDKIEDKDDFIEGGTECIINFGVGFLKVEDIVVFCGQFWRKFEKSLLKGLFWGVRILLDKVQSITFLILEHLSYRELLYEFQRSIWSGLIRVLLSHIVKILK